MSINSITNKVKLMISDHKAVILHKDPFKVLVSTLLSQRTRDETTDRVSKELFKAYPTIKSINNASVIELKRIIRGAGFYKTKAKRIKELARIVLERGVPSSFDELIKLPGVGRKTANCVLVYGFGLPAIPVDTHVHRVMNRLGVVKTTKPEKTEFKLMRLLPKNHWLELNDLFVKFGQRICKPIKPLCDEKKCLLRKQCNYYKKLKN